jgi:ParB family chromosome partitioning protein
MSKTAIEAKRGTIFMMDPDDVVVVGLDTKDGPEHPLHDERARLPVDENMVLDIMARGIISPITLRKNGDALEVQVGRQRVKSAREANIRLKKEKRPTISVPAMVRRDDDEDALAVMISENEKRVDDDQLTKAKKLKRFLDIGGTEEDAVVMFGVTKVSLKNWLSLLDLDSKVQHMVSDGKLSASAAGDLSKLERKDQVEEAQRLIAAGTTTTADVKRTVAKKRGRSRAEEDGLKPPGKVAIRKVIDLCNDGGADIDDMVLKTMRWINGEIAAKSIKGLSDALRKVGAES